MNTTYGQIHQIWFDFDGTLPPGRVPLKYEQTVSKLKSVNCSTPHILWSLDSAEKLMKQLPEIIMETFASFEINIQKADFFRYVLMYVFGGVYADLDFTAVRPLQEMCDLEYCVGSEECEIILSDEWPSSHLNTKTLHNGILISKTKRHPFWLHVMKSIIQKQQTCNEPPTAKEEREAFVYSSTGTRMLCEQAMSWNLSCSEPIGILNFKHFCSFIQDDALITCATDMKVKQGMYLVPLELALDAHWCETTPSCIYFLLSSIPSSWK